MRKFLRRLFFVTVGLGLVAAALWYGLRPHVESGMADRLRLLGFEDPAVTLLPGFDGSLTFTIRNGNKPVVTALIDVPASTGNVLQIPSLMVYGENWPASSQQPVINKERTAALWQALQTPLISEIGGYRQIEVDDLRLTLQGASGFSGQASAQWIEQAALWQGKASGTLQVFGASAPLRLDGSLTEEGALKLSGSCENLSLSVPAGRIAGLSATFALEVGQASPMISFTLKTAKLLALTDFSLSVNAKRQSGSALPFVLEAVHNRAPLKLEGVLDIPAFKATLSPSGTINTAGFSITGIKGRLTLDPLWPPVLPDGQVLEAQAVDAGLPFRTVRLVFGFRDNRLKLAEAGAQLFGGSVKLDPVTLSLPLQKADFMVHVTDIDLGQALLMANVEGLAGTGQLSGRVPLSYDRGQIIFGETAMKAAEAGTITYQPATLPSFMAEGGQGQLLGQVFKNFAYDGLTLTLGGKLGDNLTLGARLEGRNPEFYNGRAVAFNLNLSGALDSVLKNGLANFHFSPEALKTMMQLEQGAPVP